MKAPHLLRVEEGAERFAALVAAARGEGMRVGWLELAAAGEPPAELEAAAAMGCLRAVAAGEGRTVAVKRLAGAVVLRDLLREHFLGCGLVLVRGAVEAPLLAGDADGWILTPPDAPPRRLTSEQLVATLRKPRIHP